MNIFGTNSLYDLEQKTQNQTGTLTSTDFAGVLEQNGVPVATTGTIGAYLPLAGGTMSGNLDMGSHNLLNIGTVAGIGGGTRTADNILSCSTAQTTGNLLSWSALAKVAQDSAVVSANVVTNVGTGALGNLPTFSSAKVVADSGVALSSLATAASDALKLPLAGGTMTGDIDMGTHNISNITAIRPVDTNVNIGNSTSQLLGGTGNVTLTDFATTTGNYGFAAGISATAKNNAIAIGRGSIAQNNSTVVGYQSTVGATRTDSVVIGHDNTSNATSGDIFGINQTNTTANSLLLGNGSYTNIRANATCDLGTSAIPFQTAYLAGSVAGPTYTRTADNIVSNVGASTSGNLASLSGTTGKVITDSGVVATSIVVGPASAASGNLATYSGTTGKLIADSGILPSTLVVGPASAVSGNLASYSGITGKLVADSGVVASTVIAGPASAVSGNVPTYSGTTGKLIADGGVLLSALATTTAMTLADNLRVLKAGDTMSGALAMGTNNITNVGSISGATYTRAADNILSCTALPTYGNLAMFSATNKGIDDSTISSFNIVTGPASAVSGNLASYNGITGKVVLDSGVLATSIVTGPASAVNNNVALFNGTTGKVIQAGAAAIGTLGALTLANSTASTSVTTGTIICPGGAGIAGKAYIGSNTVIGPTQTIALENTLTLRGTVNSGTAGPHIAAYVSGSQYPPWQQLSYANDNVWTNYDAYFDSAWKSSSVNSNFALNKVTNQLQFNYSSGNAVGAAVAWTVAGGIDTSGILQWQKAIKTADTTASTSKTTGSIVAAGGLGVGGAGNFGGVVTISTADSTLGLDLATANCFANMRVIQNTSATADKDLYVGYNSGATSSLHLYSNNAQCVYVNKGNTVVGAAVVAAATDGFLYIPTVPATKTGIPTAYTGTIPMVFDTSVNKLVVYVGGSWKSVGPFV